MKFDRERFHGKRHGGNHLTAMFFFGITSGGILGLLIGDRHNCGLTFAAAVLFSLGMGATLAFTVAPKRIARITLKHAEKRKLTLPAIPKQRMNRDDREN